eukprot:TRINITY_DN21952_c0_g1_i1.p1 TRINITY_DN21952_c0_g1~~TRINITY_DN21952_c0_g1_i1.p1  ORF type:complete len:221 (+),score=13.35 TRINITY_DN21952_c0_g1_i1:138-800(+)
MEQINVVVLGKIDAIEEGDLEGQSAPHPHDVEADESTAASPGVPSERITEDTDGGTSAQEKQRVRSFTTVMATADTASCLWAVVYFLCYGSAPLTDAAPGFVVTWNFLMVITFAFYALGGLYCCNPLATTREARLTYLKTWLSLDILVVLHLLVYSFADLRDANVILTRLLSSLCQLVRICRVVPVIRYLQEIRHPRDGVEAGLGAVPVEGEQVLESGPN